MPSGKFVGRDDETVPLLSSDNSRTSLSGYEDVFRISEVSASESEAVKPLQRASTPRTPHFTRKFTNNNPSSVFEVNYFLKGKNPTSLSVVADSEVLPPTEARNQSSIVTIFVLWNTMVGTSLLTMPWGMERAGLAMGIALVAGMGALCCYTAHCVVTAQAAHGLAGGEISELTRHMLGRKAELLSKIFSYVVLVGALIVYWILMSNFLYFTVDYLYTAGTGGFDFVSTLRLNGSERCLATVIHSNFTAEDQSLFQQFWNLEISVPIYLVILVGPLLSFKSVTFFTKFNSLGTLSLVYLMVFVMAKAWTWGIHLDFTNESSSDYSSLFESSFFATSGMLAMSYFMQNIVISVMRSNKNQKHNARDLAAAYSLAMGTYLFVGVVFYISFPLPKSCIEDNLLNNFASWDMSTLVARVFLFFQLITVFPLISFMLRYQVMTAFFKIPFPSRLHVVCFNAVIVTACVLFAIFLPRIGTIIRFTGALSGFFHVFTLPCLLRLASQKQTGTLTVGSLVLHLGIPLAGCINLIAQFFVSDR